MVAVVPAGSEQVTVMLALSLQSPSLAITAMVDGPTCVQVNVVVLLCAVDRVPLVVVQA